MNKLVLKTVFVLLFLSSCTGKPEESQKSINQAESSILQTGNETIDAFICQLSDLKDHPNKASVKSTTEYNYMIGDSDGEYFTLSGTDVFDIERFTVDKRDGITVREGTYTLEDDSSRYVAQVYHDEEYFYLLTDYKSKMDRDTKKTMPYLEDAIEDNLSINFSYKEIQNLAYLTKFDNEDSILGEYNLPDSIPNDGEVSYKYSLTIYEQGYLNQKISHEVKFTIENGTIVSSTQTVENDLFGGTRQKINYSLNVTEITYTQGDYQEFDGKLFDPDNFIEIE